MHKSVTSVPSSTPLPTPFSGGQDGLFAHLDSWAGIDRWFDFMVQYQIGEQARGDCPIGSLAAQLAERGCPIDRSGGVTACERSSPS